MTPSFDTLRLERSGRVALVIYERPERCNAWSPTAAREAVEAVVAANNDEDIGAIVLTGSGGHFCAGSDRKVREIDHETGRMLSPATFTMGKGDYNWLALMARSKPVVAAVNGPAVGIGATHALAADIRIMARSASFAFPFLELGAMPECGSTALLPRIVGEGRARHIILQNSVIDAPTAVEWGLASEVVEDHALMNRAVEVAGQIAELPPLQVRLTRQMLLANRSSDDPASIMRIENAAFIELMRTLGSSKPLG